MAARPSALFVQVSPANYFAERLETKLEIYFQSQKRSGGGECNVRAVDRHQGIYWVEFESDEVTNRVKTQEQHFLKINDRPLKICIVPDHKVMATSAEGPFTNNLINLSESLPSASSALQLQNDFEKQQPSKKHAADLPESVTRKIFLHVSATLNTDLLTKEERAQVSALCPSLRIDQISSKHGIERVTGDYVDIEKLYHHFERLIRNSQNYHGLSHSERHNGSEKVNVEEWKGRSENDLDRVLDMEVPTGVFEYFRRICQERIEELEEKFNVKLISKESGNGLTSIRLTATGSPNFLEKAQQIFVTDFQKVAADLKQEMIHFTNSQQCSKVQEMLNTHCKQVLTKKDKDTLILRGPAREIAAAKGLVEEIEAENFTKQHTHHLRKNGIEVDMDVFELLEPKLAREIESINKKYNTVMDKKSCLKSRTARIVFKPEKNKNSDGFSEANERFGRAYQKALTLHVEKVLPLKLSASKKKRLDELFFQLERENPRVVLKKTKNDLIVSGMPDCVCAAEKHIMKFLNMDVPAVAAGGPAHVPVPNSGVISGAPPKQNHDHKMDSSPSTEPPSSKAAEDKQEEKCSICMDKICQKTVLSKCKHEFCRECIEMAMKYKPVCPVCSTFYGQIKGNQPEGSMTFTTDASSLPGYERCGTININYYICSGIQTEGHPHPGRSFTGTTRRAYLPNNKEGQEILQLLQRAFNQKLIFTVGQSRTTGINDVVTWNDIHHKTCTHGGPDSFGYPDPYYLKRVREELKAKGIE